MQDKHFWKAAKARAGEQRHRDQYGSGPTDLDTKNKTDGNGEPTYGTVEVNIRAHRKNADDADRASQRAMRDRASNQANQAKTGKRR